MFFGQYCHSLDSKKRLTIPACFRDDLKAGAYVMRGLDSNLMVFTSAVFEKINQNISTLSITNESARDLRRIFFGNAGYLELDGAGRILIPDYLRNSAGIQNDTVITGAGGYFEIWTPEAWSQRQAYLQASEANKESFAALEIPTS